MKLLPVILLAAFVSTAFAHGDHDHDSSPSTPPPKVGAPAEEKKSDKAADPATIKEEKAPDAAKPADKKP